MIAFDFLSNVKDGESAVPDLLFNNAVAMMRTYKVALQSANTGTHGLRISDCHL
jgi:hypothetical protein